MSETKEVQSPFGTSSDSAYSSTEGPPAVGKDVIDAEVLVIQTNSSALVKKERHVSSSSQRSSSISSEEYYCGVGKCRPKWLQVFVNARFFTFLLCLNCFIEGALVSGECCVVSIVQGINTVEVLYTARINAMPVFIYLSIVYNFNHIVCFDLHYVIV